MIISPILLVMVLITTSQHIDGYPSMLSKDMKKNHPINLRFKRDFGHLQGYELANPYNNDGILSSFDNDLPYTYLIMPRQNHKRLIDF